VPRAVEMTADGSQCPTCGNDDLLENIKFVVLLSQRKHASTWLPNNSRRTFEVQGPRQFSGVAQRPIHEEWSGEWPGHAKILVARSADFEASVCVMLIVFVYLHWQEC
jgi:hypothetical protein